MMSQTGLTQRVQPIGYRTAFFAMLRAVRFLKRLTLVLFAICVFARLFVVRARGLATNFGLGLGAFRVLLIGVDIRAGRLPWQRILVPALILAQVLLVVAGIAEKSSA